MSLRDQLWNLLGDLPPLFTPTLRIVSRRELLFFDTKVIIEDITFENGADATVPGYILYPSTLRKPAPAILYNHLHGNKYSLGKDEVFMDTMNPIPPALMLVSVGFVVMCIDAYAFGARSGKSPHIRSESGAAMEMALYKYFLWRGSTLWGMMLRDDILALNALAARPEVDPQRIGATGMSLGGSRTSWLAALDDRIAALVPTAQLTRYADFAANQNYNLHGIYYYLPGMLKTGIDMEDIVAAAAPRPQTIVIGDSDPLSPIAGIYKIIDYAAYIYAKQGASDRFQVLIEPGVGHSYTSNMFHMMIDTFRDALHPITDTQTYYDLE